MNESLICSEREGLLVLLVEPVVHEFNVLGLG